MAGKNKADYTKPANTFIGKGVTVQAQALTGTESVRIDGVFNGDINLDGYLQLGNTGRVNGDITVSYALIAGKVRGNIVCHETLHMTDGSEITGDITSGKLIVDEGAIIQGYCKTGNTDIVRAVQHG